MQMDDLPTDRQAQTETAFFIAGCFRGEVAGGHHLQILAGNPLTGISHTDSRLLPALPRTDALDIDADGGSGIGGVDGIGNDVSQQALDENLVDLDGERRVALDFDLGLVALEFRV